jgi:GTP-binding protein HflX
LNRNSRDQDRTLRETPDAPEAAVLVGVQLPSESDEEALESLSELEALARTAGAGVAATLLQRRKSYDPATVLGSGKVDEVRAAAESSDADLVIFDNDLTVTQQDRLESALGARVIDRTALILDIFAQHAHTREGSTQVELAQLSYLLPRIRGKGVELSRMGGGYGAGCASSRVTWTRWRRCAPLSASGVRGRGSRRSAWSATRTAANPLS